MMDAEMRERLADDEGLQARLLPFVRNRVQYSWDWLSPRHDRWREGERLTKVFRVADDSDEETRAEPLTEGVQKIVVPVTYAQIWSMLAFVMNALHDRKPMIPVEGVGPRDVRPALIHELLLEHQWDSMAIKGILAVLQWYHDGFRYGLGVVHNQWTLRIFTDFVRNVLPVQMDGQHFGFEDNLEEQDVVDYEGNEFRNIQPFDWIPDPRMGSIARFQEGEFCGHSFLASHTDLLAKDDEGLYAGVDLVPDFQTPTEKGGMGARGWQDSDLGTVVGISDSMPSAAIDADGDPFKRCHSLYAWVRPRDLRLPDYGSPSHRPKLWVFTMANQARIIRAERANLPGRKFPYALFEPNFDLHAPANPSVSEVISGLQYIYSWLVNSRVVNVRRSLNNETIIDPSLIERDDWARSNASGIWRLTKQAMQSGISLDNVARPLPVNDVTQGHWQDSGYVSSLIEQTTGASRQIQGLANTGRRAATEVQGQMAMAAGRMRLLLLIHAAQGLTDLAEQQVANNRAFLEQRLTVRIRDRNYAKVLGQDYLDVTPDLLQGLFRIPLLESGIPTDKLMHQNALQQILTMGMNDPNVAAQLSNQINWSEIFAELMRVMNIRNLKDFFAMPQPGQPQPGQPQQPPQMQAMPDDQVQRQVQAGNLVPTDGAPYFGAAAGAPGMSSAANLLG